MRISTNPWRTHDRADNDRGAEWSYVSMLELDQSSPTAETLLRVCDALGIKASNVISKVERLRKL